MRLARALTVLFVLGLGVDARAGDPPPVDARTELQAAIDILKTHHMNRDKVDWPKVSAEAFTSLGSAKTAEEAYPAIIQVIAALGEKHTFMLSASYVKAMTTDKTVGTQLPPYWAPPEGHLLEGGIGFVSVHAFLANGDLYGADYANGARAAFETFATAHVCRFIIDLRANPGRNMWPMINGVEAVLGDGVLGYWQDSAGVDNAPWPGTTGRYNDSPKSKKAIGMFSKAPVAVLLGAQTASAGEFTAIAFEGRPNTRFFGETTAGFVSTNSVAPLPDGAEIAVSTGYSTDRLHRPYRSAIVPDEATPRGQPTLDAAIAWLKRQPCPKR